MNRLLGVVLSVLTAALSFAETANAQPFPQQPIRLVVGFGPGSGADAIARVLAEGLGEQLKIAVVVENRDGAGSAIATAYVAKAPPDGYTLLLGATTMTVSPHLQATAPYDPVRDFVPIIKVAELPLLMIAAPDAPFKTLKELVAYAKSNPGKLNYATSGKGSPSHLGVELIRKAAGIDVRDVPYKNVGQAMTDVISGQVSFYFPAVTGAAPHVKSGRVKGLAIGAAKRSSQFPEVPTVAEEIGAQGLEVITWYGLLAPAGLPKEIATRLYTETTKVIESTDARGRILKTGADVVLDSPEEFAAQIRSDNVKYGKLIRELGLKD
jgi:tripartite-type tricarboxylate transporter receptor subunit TctC